MLWLFIDESGDLGFKFSNKSSEYLTVCILAISQPKTLRRLSGAVRETLCEIREYRNIEELKGYSTRWFEKCKFWNRARSEKGNFFLISKTIYKRRVHKILTRDKGAFYNWAVRLTLDKLYLEPGKRIKIIIDKSKSVKGIEEFDRYILNRLQRRIAPSLITIDHLPSIENPLLQVVDLFTWGIQRYRSTGDTEWFGMYQRSVANDVYLPPPKKKNLRIR